MKSNNQTDVVSFLGEIKAVCDKNSVQLYSFSMKDETDIYGNAIQLLNISVRSTTVFE